MNCKELSELIDLYSDGELPEEVGARVDRHLIQCPDCAYAARSVEQSRALLRQAFAPEEPSPSYRERAEARLHSELADVLKTQAPESAAQWSLPNLDD